MKSNNKPDTIQNAARPICDYLPLEVAAKELNCSRAELLHLGARAKAKILGAVSGGFFEWMIGVALDAFPEMDHGLEAWFDFSDRIVMMPFDLARIEAVGWAIPETFFAPERAEQLSRYNQAFHNSDKSQSQHHEEAFISHLVTQKMAELEVKDWHDAGQQYAVLREEVVAKGIDPEALETYLAEQNERNAMFRKTGLHAPWQAITPIEDRADRTTIDQLFISTSEITRLRGGLPLSPDEQTILRSIQTPPHGNAERFARLREEILAAAIFCMVKSNKVYKTASALIEAVEQAAPKVWPDTGQPPPSVDTVKKVIEAAFRGECHRRNNNSGKLGGTKSSKG